MKRNIIKINFDLIPHPFIDEHRQQVIVNYKYNNLIISFDNDVDIRLKNYHGFGKFNIDGKMAILVDEIINYDISLEELGVINKLLIEYKFDILNLLKEIKIKINPNGHKPTDLPPQYVIYSS